ncbi:hypothetical protein GF345_00290 [Candidatus Woesearchaeota archaeon]|nr:hypothetical protein [Candidatus Woesearchaeota archaeon]
MPKKVILNINQPTDNPAVDLVLDTLEKKKQALVFVNTKRGAERAAEDIAKKTNIKDAAYKAQLEKISHDILKALPKPTRQCEREAFCIKKGIAFHHAGLTQKQKTLIEDAFRERVIKIIACTPTLSFGLNLPAFRAIIRDLKRYTRHGLDWIPVLEYHQMAGRCGRPGSDKWGEAICIAQNESDKEKITEMFLNGESEEIFSKLAVEPVLRTYVLSLIASGFASSQDDLEAFFSKTFWAHQYEDMDKLGGIIDRMVSLLVDFEFVESSGSRSREFVSADEVGGNSRLAATRLGKRVAELYIDPLTAHKMIIAMQRASEKIVNEFSFIHLVSSCPELRPLLKVRSKEYEEIESKIAEHESSIIVLEPSLYDPEYEEFQNSIKTALFFNDWIEENDEEDLLEKYNIRPGEIKVKRDLADWLLYTAEELARLTKKAGLLKVIIKSRMRLRYGVKEELLPLLRLEGIGRVRARKLFRNGIIDSGEVRKADLMKLVQILGKNTAIRVKKQVGQDFDKAKVPERRRKGQVSLKDY